MGHCVWQNAHSAHTNATNVKLMLRTGCCSILLMLTNHVYSSIAFVYRQLKNDADHHMKNKNITGAYGNN